MKNIWQYILGSISILSVISCQKEIDVKLNTADQVYIVDALLTDEAGTNYVKVTKSKSFYENNDFPSISNALVTIAHDNLTDTLAYDPSNGYYTLSSFTAMPNTTYDLTIIIGNDTIKSSNSLPDRKVNLDSFKVEESPFSFFEVSYVAVPYYTDPVGRGDYYILQGYCNGQKTASVETDSDEFIDGTLNKSSITVRKQSLDDEEPEFKNGDTLTAELMTVRKPVYTFYNTLQLNSSAFAGNPANPTSNVIGNAIGVFSVAYIDRKTIIASF